MASMLTSPLELATLGQIVEELGNGGDLVGFLRHASLRQNQTGGGGVSAERVQRLGALPAIVGAPGRLAVDGDEFRPVRPRRRHPTLEAALEQDGINPVEKNAQPALAGHAVGERRKAAQEIEMELAPGRDVVEIVARANRAANHQKQHLGQRINDAPGLPPVWNLRKMLQKQG